MKVGRAIPLAPQEEKGEGLEEIEPLPRVEGEEDEGGPGPL